MGIWRGLSGVIFPTSWNFLGNHDDLGLFGDLAWVIWGYLGIWRGLSRAIWGFARVIWGYWLFGVWGFGVDYPGLFGDLARIIWGYFPHFLEFFGES